MNILVICIFVYKTECFFRVGVSRLYLLAQSGLPSVLIKKLYQNTAMLIVYGCFPTAVAGSSSCDRKCIVCKAGNIYYLAFFLF